MGSIKKSAPASSQQGSRLKKQQANAKAKSGSKSNASAASQKKNAAPAKAASAQVAAKKGGPKKPEPMPAAKTSAKSAKAAAAAAAVTAAPVSAKGGKAAAAPTGKPGAKGAKGNGAHTSDKRRAADSQAALANLTALSKGGGRGTMADAVAGAGDTVCREVACEGLATSGGYCRLHYIKNWKKIKRKELILKERKLNQYIEELVAKYPDKYIEAIRQDLANDKDFAKVISDLDLDENLDDFDVDAESLEGLVDNIKRDFEDEGESF